MLMDQEMPNLVSLVVQNVKSPIPFFPFEREVNCISFVIIFLC